LRGVLPGPWGHGGGLESVGREVRQSSNLRFAGGVGRQDYYGVKPSAIATATNHADKRGFLGSRRTEAWKGGAAY
jgi:hypothetical protein